MGFASKYSLEKSQHMQISIPEFACTMTKGDLCIPDALGRQLFQKHIVS